eukprot:symbB.v1.2.001879.t1/scaffold79.1/size344139/10
MVSMGFGNDLAVANRPFNFLSNLEGLPFLPKKGQRSFWFFLFVLFDCTAAHIEGELSSSFFRSFTIRTSIHHHHAAADKAGRLQPCGTQAEWMLFPPPLKVQSRNYPEGGGHGVTGSKDAKGLGGFFGSEAAFRSERMASRR